MKSEIEDRSQRGRRRTSQRGGRRYSPRGPKQLGEHPNGEGADPDIVTRDNADDRIMDIADLKEKAIQDLANIAVDLEIEGASSMRKQECTWAQKESGRKVLLRKSQVPLL